MAKVLFTAIVAEISGRLAGSVFQKSVGGYQLHSLRVPINRRVWRQQKNRVTMEFLASNWRTLTPEQQAEYTGSTNRERFSNYISNQWQWAWGKQTIAGEPITPNPQPWYSFISNWTQYNDGELWLWFYSEGEESTDFAPYQLTLMMRDWTPPGQPVNGEWRPYQIPISKDIEDGYFWIETNNDIIPKLGAVPSGYKSEIQIIQALPSVQYISDIYSFTAGV